MIQRKTFRINPRILFICFVLSGLCIAGLPLVSKGIAAPPTKYSLCKNRGGPLLGYSSGSGVKIIESGGFFFKDMNKNGKLIHMKTGVYRLTPEQKSATLMTIDRSQVLCYIADTRLFQPVQRPGAGMYNGKPLLKAVLWHQIFPMRSWNF